MSGSPNAAGLHVALLTGGPSDERDVALDSGRAVERALGDGSDGRGPARVTVVEWTLDGRFRVSGQQGDLRFLLEALGTVDAVFLAVHGGPGEDGTLQGALELAGLPYTGSGVGASAVAADKSHFLSVAESHGARVPRGVRIERGDDSGRRDALLEQAAAFGVSSWFLKPNSGGSSVGTARVGDPGELRSACEGLLERTDAVRIEEAVEGVEATAPVLGHGQSARALTPVEIVPTQGAFFDYRQKYSSDGAAEHCPPASIDVDVQAAMQSEALRLHRALGCRGVTRVDYLVSAEAGPVVLELNTLPGFTDRSLAPMAAAHDGIDFRELCLLLIEDAVADAAERSAG